VFLYKTPLVLYWYCTVQWFSLWFYPSQGDERVKTCVTVYLPRGLRNGDVKDMSIKRRNRYVIVARNSRNSCVLDIISVQLKRISYVNVTIIRIRNVNIIFSRNNPPPIFKTAWIRKRMDIILKKLRVKIFGKEWKKTRKNSLKLKGWTLARHMIGRKLLY